MRTIISLLLAAITLLGCGNTKPDQEAQQRALILAADGDALLVDVRSTEEVAGGRLDGAIHIPHPEIVAGLAKRGISKDSTVVLYCRSGNRSGMAAKALTDAGFSHVINAGAYQDLLPLQSRLGSTAP